MAVSTSCFCCDGLHGQKTLLEPEGLPLAFNCAKLAPVGRKRTLLRQDAGSLVTYRFESLVREGLTHAVFTRLGGVSSPPFDALNVGHTVGDDPEAVATNHARIYTHLSLGAGQVASPRQVHSSRIAAVTAKDAGTELPGTDGLVTNIPGVALFLRFADCQPILLYDPVAHALGLIHAGWRGVAQAIARRAVQTMQQAFGSQPEDLVAGLGPAIGPCCYTVGHSVASAMGYVLPDWNQALRQEEDGWRLDLCAANVQQLEAAGVRSIEQAQLCTACHNNIFYSHRAEKGRTGRFAVVAYLEALVSKEPSMRTPALQVEAELENTMQPESLHPPGFPPF